MLMPAVCSELIYPHAPARLFVCMLAVLMYACTDVYDHAHCCCLGINAREQTHAHAHAHAQMSMPFGDIPVGQLRCVAVTATH